MRRSLGVITRVDRLRHDAMVSRYNQHNEIGHIGAARADGGEGRVAWRVNESKCRAIMIDAVRSDMLSDPAGFTSRYARLANRVQKRGLAMIDVSHERDDGATWLELLLLFNNCRRRRDNWLFHLVDTR